jgi:hypothetical protein
MMDYETLPNILQRFERVRLLLLTLTRYDGLGGETPPGWQPWNGVELREAPLDKLDHALDWLSASARAGARRIVEEAADGTAQPIARARRLLAYAGAADEMAMAALSYRTKGLQTARLLLTEVEHALDAHHAPLFARLQFSMWEAAMFRAGSLTHVIRSAADLELPFTPPGDDLAVSFDEPWAENAGGGFSYEADYGLGGNPDVTRWVPAPSMPRAAARLFSKVTARQTTRFDAIAPEVQRGAGIPATPEEYKRLFGDLTYSGDLRERFRTVWDWYQGGGHRAAAANPFVITYTVRAPVRS